MVRPETVTAIPEPTELVANTPVADTAFNVTVSPGTTPIRDALPVLSAAVVDASYVLLFAVIPETVRDLVVMLALAVG